MRTAGVPSTLSVKYSRPAELRRLQRSSRRTPFGGLACDCSNPVEVLVVVEHRDTGRLRRCGDEEVGISIPDARIG